jgi:hypothetical protein
VTVHFDEPREFMIELERDALDGLIANKIVRRVTRRQSSETGSQWVLSTVVAYRARGEVVECVYKRGELPFNEKAPADSMTLKRVDIDRQAFADFCAQHGLDLRSGTFR